MTPARSSVAAMRHKLLPAFAGHVTICTRSLVGEGDLVHHCDSGVPEASLLVRSVELYPYIQSAFEQKTQLVSRLSKTATGAISMRAKFPKGPVILESGRNKVRDRQNGPSDRMIIPKTLNFTPSKQELNFGETQMASIGWLLLACLPVPVNRPRCISLTGKLKSPQQTQNC